MLGWDSRKRHIGVHCSAGDLGALPEPQRDLADRINRLRDRLDDLLFGYQDYALVGTRPG